MKGTRLFGFVHFCGCGKDKERRVAFDTIRELNYNTGNDTLFHFFIQKTQ